MIISKCGCFTVETGGVILATWTLMQMIYAMGLVSFLWYVYAHFYEEAHYFGFILLLISIAAICIALLSIKGIEKRNHWLILPMLILSSVLLMLQLANSYYCLKSLFDPDDSYLYLYLHRARSFQKVIVVAAASVTIVLSVLSVLVFLSLYDLFQNEPRRGQNEPRRGQNGRIYQQQFVPTTQNVESHLES